MPEPSRESSERKEEVLSLWGKKQFDYKDEAYQRRMIEEYFDFYEPAFPRAMNHKMLQYTRIFWLMPCLVIFTLSLIKLRYSSLVIFLT